MPKHHLMTSVKNEAVYLLEWVAHHRAVGFDNIYIAANNCNDGTVALLRELDANGFVKFAHNHCGPDAVPQHEGYKVLRKRYDVDQCDWLMILDIDEFLHVELGDGSVGALTAAATDDVDVIALNSLIFGSETSEEFLAPVTRRFQHRKRETDQVNRTIKSITRNPSRFRGAHNHHLVKLRPAGRLTVMRANGATFVIPTGADDLWHYLRHSPRGEIAQDMAFYNHYAVKTPEEYSLRKQRGNGAERSGASTKQRYSDAYFRKRASADILDTRISKYAPETQAMIKTMLDVPAIKTRQAEAEQMFLKRIKREAAKGGET